jgi:serine/threonine protein kinase
MKLWSDYEGRTIAEAYPLKKLVRPEGRSAFFLTTNGTGTPALVRVIEAHFDESEILTRWKTVSEIGQENLITMRKFGETELDGTPLVYAVMEPTEISLEELLYNRTLTVDEARELAHSLVGAIQALHACGLVHGQIEPANILAAGELVKLRSDCVKEAVDDPDGIGPNVAEQKSADAHALAIVLLQALTGRSSLQGSATLLPSPFDGIIRNGLSGRWGLAEMSSALGPVKPKQVAETPAPATKTVVAPAVTGTTAASSATPQTVKAVETTAATKPETPIAAKIETPAAIATKPTQENLFSVPTLQPTAATKPEVFVSAAKPAATPVSPAHSPKAVAESLAAAPIAEKKSITPTQAPDVRHRIVKPVEEDPRRTRIWIAATAAIILLLVLGWRLMRSEPAANVNGATKPISTLGDPDKTANSATKTPAPLTSTKPSATKLAGNGRASAPRIVAPSPAPVSSAVPSAIAGARTQWRVVAYTYNHQDQAQQKADSIAKQHPSLNPEVFSPTGHAPYLVTVGGPMSREQAEAFRQKARGEGLPHDIYAQNYSH